MPSAINPVKMPAQSGNLRIRFLSEFINWNLIWPLWAIPSHSSGRVKLALNSPVMFPSRPIVGQIRLCLPPFWTPVHFGNT
jgi:hypothetical protein